MAGLLLRRLAAALLLLYLVLTLVFFLVQIAPGEPFQILDDPRAPREARENLRRIYGLDRPLGEQYVSWLAAVTLEGNWGTSFVHQRPVTEVLLDAFPNTLVLALAAMAINYAIGLPLGIAAARRQGKAGDHLIRISSLLLYSLPVFWLGLMAILLFSYVWPILPAGHMYSVASYDQPPMVRLLDLLRHLVLPALVLGGASAGGTARFVRNSLLEILGEDYIRTARAKGLKEDRVIWVHGLRNALVPVIQLFGLALPTLLNGSLVTEVVFSWPGIGRLSYDAMLTRDFPLILAATAFTGLLVILGNLAADLLHVAADPRLRHD